MLQLATSSYRLSKVRRSFMGLGVKFCNKVPKQIRDLPVESFKKLVKA